MIDRLNDPVLRQLARLEPLEPDPRHSASVRSRCQATLARRREQRESTARSRATVAGIFELALTCTFSLVYAAAVIRSALAMYGGL